MTENPDVQKQSTLQEAVDFAFKQFRQVVKYSTPEMIPVHITTLHETIKEIISRVEHPDLYEGR